MKKATLGMKARAKMCITSESVGKQGGGVQGATFFQLFAERTRAAF